jgi:hypothetical protein
MSKSQRHRFYTSKVAAGPEVLFDLIAAMPNYDRWLPASEQYAEAYAGESDRGQTGQVLLAIIPM